MSVFTKLNRDFYLRDTLLIAQELLGMVLVHNSEEGILGGEIVETEAYIGPDDAASHAFKGIKTPRTEVQFGVGGYSYVYKIYGMYDCFCIVTEPEGKPCVVLIRSLKPVIGIDLMMKYRRMNNITAKPNKRILQLCNGPSKLCKAMGITKEKHYGLDLCGDNIYISRFSRIDPEHIVAAKRVNIDYAGEMKNYLWRFYISHCEYISRP
jgi:DNA-3-methyladenine glycosylase